MTNDKQTETNPNPFQEVPIEISVSIGKAHPKIKEMLALCQDDLLTLDKTIDDPVDLFVGNKLIARGALEQIENDTSGKLAVRLIEIISPNDLI